LRQPGALVRGFRATPPGGYAEGMSHANDPGPATPLAAYARERPHELPQRSMQIERLAELTQQALDAFHRADSGVEFANKFSTLAPHLQQLVGIVKP